MWDLLEHLFAAVCGQNVDHTWAPGGMLLPCCQRCTGLYAGAALAALLHWRARPKFTGRFLEVHGAFLLLMAPFGFHWLPQGPFLRTVTGTLFGFAVVTFLWLCARQGWGSAAPARVSPSPLSLSPSERERVPQGGRGCRIFHTCSEDSGLARDGFRAYFLGSLASAILVPLLAAWGGKPAALLLSGLVCGGAVVLLALVAANLGLCPLLLIRLFRRLASVPRQA